MPRETWNPEQKRGGGGRTLSATVGEIIIRKAIWISLQVALLSLHSMPEVGFDADWNQFDKVHCPRAVRRRSSRKICVHKCMWSPNSVFPSQKTSHKSSS